MRKLLKDFLTRQAYTVHEARDGNEAMLQFQQIKPLDLIILDIMMPGIDGWEVCRKIRQQSDVPILMLTAKEEEYDQLFGFQLGADDYVTKPFSPSILVARVAALLKRTKMKSEQPSAKEWMRQGLHVKLSAGKVWVDGQLVDLSPKEYDLLIYFIHNEGLLLSREQLLENVWGYDYFGDVRTVDTHMNRLRLKISPYDTFIHTIRGKGYRFEGYDEK
ncbi:DNA-binding response OmpR family regulator [Paenibacillus phyllosphaerae]|uniref:DNA-binding response OmpR family regulator n=2 Tax=Paenibacillus phyllosphaerae TaxID=274593 RepID=A0A7W5B2S4_9BACL|nr:DNA-binding response OmpR family regulator [Paenibacillus phyllosphaerae]